VAEGLPWRVWRKPPRRKGLGFGVECAIAPLCRRTDPVHRRERGCSSCPPLARSRRPKNGSAAPSSATCRSSTHGSTESSGERSSARGYAGCR
jgi:hypothetical protein